MKTLKMFALVVVFTFSSAVSASTNPSKDAEPKSLTESVSELLQKPNFEVEKSVEAKVFFMINNDNEFVVLSVESTDEGVKNFIKRRLNYKKVERNGYGSQIYTIPVKIEATS
ncbi:hypothetical protein [Winogradskyella sp. A3E31]|uniref:hypothetical protein n=1 Tax=Winogradskyella sp. A3E31 TaxID=3349637 RepID=UPI00398B7136